MNAEKWQKIASSFSYTENEKLSQEILPGIQPPLKSNPAFTVPIPIITNHTVELENPTVVSVSTSRSRISPTTPRCMGRSIAEMKFAIQKLSMLVEEKSEIIKEQEETITKLQTKLETFSIGYYPNIPNQIPQVLSNDTKVKKGAKRAECAERKTSDSKISTSILPVILNRLEDLEKRMTQFSKSLPKRIQLYCQQYISNCKFRYDETGELLVAVVTSPQSTSSTLKPIWERSPRIKPKVNYSSQIRQKSRTPSYDKENTNPLTNSNEGVENYLKHLETIVNDLKVGFVQLFLQKVIGISKKCNSNPNDKNVKLDRIRNVVQNL